MGYTSRIQPREHKIREGDFEELPALIFNDDNSNPAQRKRDIALWNKHIQITPEEFMDVIQSWFYIDLRVDVKLDRKGLMTVTLQDPKGRFLESFFSANLKENKFSESSTIRLTSGNQGKGLASEWLACQVELYAALGARALNHKAQLMNGAHNWARTGMYIDFENTEPEKLVRMRRNLKVKLEAFLQSGLINQEKYNEMLPFTELKNKDDLVQLLAHDFIIPEAMASSEGVQINRDFMDALVTSMEEQPLLGQETSPRKEAEEVAGTLVTIWNRTQPKHKPISFTQFGLFQSQYTAIASFDDTDQMEAIGSRVRGWKFGTLTA